MDGTRSPVATSALYHRYPSTLFISNASREHLRLAIGRGDAQWKQLHRGFSPRMSKCGAFLHHSFSPHSARYFPRHAFAIPSRAKHAFPASSPGPVSARFWLTPIQILSLRNTCEPVICERGEKESKDRMRDKTTLHHGLRGECHEQPNGSTFRSSSSSRLRRKAKSSPTRSMTSQFASPCPLLWVSCMAILPSPRARRGC